MRAILILWSVPLIGFWGWYGLSYYDLNFGLHFLTREFHELIFRIYERILGIPAADIPATLAWIFFVDTLIILAIAALRWYKHWLPQTLEWLSAKTGFELNLSPIEKVILKLNRFFAFFTFGRKREREPVEAGQVQPAE